ncbi:MAG: putative basic amino acid antiporter YfcC [Candidatus Aminicenantes bacterium]|nr:putative basic amino acid antiporter YfcC [Candidatus Aminicenantes bacterium]
MSPKPKFSLKKLRLPHTLILIYAMVVLTVIATWIIPGGEFQRVEKDGRTVPVAGTYERTESSPQGLGALFVSPVRGFVEAAAIIAILFVVGGAFSVIQKTGTITVVIQNVAVKFGRSRALRALLIPVTMILFSLGGAIWGMCEETMPFILIFVPLALSLGYDTIVGVSIPFLGAAAGFAGAFFNPFTVGIAQGIAGLPLYSGLGYRLIVWALGTAIAIAVVMRYAARIRKDPALSPVYEDDLEKKRKLLGDGPVVESLAMTAAHKRVLVVFAGGFGVMVFGILKYKWFILEIAGLFLAMGVLSGIFGRLKGDDVGRAFVDGARDMMNAALIIGTARAILIVATDGRVLDTLLAGLAGAVSQFHPLVSAQLMFFGQCVINFFLHSGTAQAALTIPVMAPLGDLVGITRQTAVLAFQLCEYINPVLPTSGVTMGVLGLAGLKWEKWARWLVPLLVLWVLFGMISLVPPVLTKWGPH